MIALPHVKKITAGVTIGLLSLSFLQSPAFAASQVQVESIRMENSILQPDSSQYRIEGQNELHDYFKSLPERTLTVLIAADEQFRTKHPDWKSYTKNLVEEGTKDFKEYYNIKYVPAQFLEWQSDGKNDAEIRDDLSRDYGSYAQNKMKDTINFSLVIGFTNNPNFGGTGGIAGTTVSLNPDNGGKSAIITINDDDRHPRPITQLIKHEVSHTYSVPNDHEYSTQNSVMSTFPSEGIFNPEWSAEEMKIILKNRNRYPNREIKEVTSFNNKFKVNRTGNLFFTEVMSSPQAGLGYINGYAQVDIDIDKKPFADFHMLETVKNINERLNSIGMVGNEITFTKLFSPNAGAANPTDTYKFN